MLGRRAFLRLGTVLVAGFASAARGRERPPCAEPPVSREPAVPQHGVAVRIEGWSLRCTLDAESLPEWWIGVDSRWRSRWR